MAKYINFRCGQCKSLITVGQIANDNGIIKGKCNDCGWRNAIVSFSESFGQYKQEKHQPIMRDVET